MKIIFQPHTEITPQQLLNFPENREIKMKVVPRIEEKIWIMGKLYEIVDVHYNTTANGGIKGGDTDTLGIICFVK